MKLLRDSALLDAGIAGVTATIVALIVAHGRNSPYNNYVLLADAFVHGRIAIAWPGPFIDAVLFDGVRYVVNDPVPALLLVPFVALWGLAANETTLACALCGVGIGATWWLLRRLGLSIGPAVWLTVFAFVGTDLLWCSMLGDVWFIAQTSAFAFTMLALCELAGARRGWLVGLWFALALGSRFTLVVALPMLGYWAWDGLLERARRPREAIAFCAALVPFAVAWVAYNLVRWHVPWDAGHTIFYHQDPYLGAPTGSPFALVNVPMQLWSFFVLPPVWNPAKWPYLVPAVTGTALWFTSPAFALAFFARSPRRTVLTLWAATVLVAGPSMFYYANGGAQFGMRHALDFAPFVLVLMALAAREGLARIWQACIAWSAAAGAWGIWFWNTVLRPGM